ncbi:NAD(+) diphosphatase [Nocardioides sp. JQ2195]|uniref:NAD(+) diphosphatase n=1 Tax=Nocardioides sp. JQ2195 TaxID=2592334 RepID=UPI00143E539D|nr:NAD(+) diphosphatase [Nocardioides sp. JQ2195]QIX27618.1 NAD(+) diphosphatase [Nocardioides sp. JQ2195]
MDRDLPHLALSEHAHNRHGFERTDEAWLDDRWADPATRVLLVAGNRLRPVGGALEWLSPADCPDGGLRVLLGEQHGVTHFALVLAPDRAPGPKDDWVVLRGALGALAGDGAVQAPLVMHAIGMAEWHWATRHCPRCGGALRAEQAGHVLTCVDCERQQFPRSDPAVIMLIAHGEPGSSEERCLLGRGASWPEGRFSTLAGFVEPGETMEDAVRREVMEETGVAVGPVDYFGSQPWPLPASLMVGFLGRATSTDVNVDGAEVAEARWFTRAEMAEQARDGSIVLPGGVSISRSLVEHWYGGPLPGSW